MFSSFHHFDPEDARAILTDSFGRREGIAIFEAAERSATSICAVFFIPLLALVLAPGIRFFRWSRLLWTYLMPIVPLVLWMDGILSCLRSYSQADIAELIGRAEFGELFLAGRAGRRRDSPDHLSHRITGGS
jgi:hypothetical protein